jgi:3-dehydroquinate synthase/2-deoxy-scyllo-inosose synthase
MPALATRQISLGEHLVPYHYGVDCTAELTDALIAAAPGIDTFLFVHDRNVGRHASPVIAHLSKAARVVTFGIDATERNKTMATVEALIEHAVGRGVDRNSMTIAMGGGMVGNVAGLAAALAYRGTRLTHLPTTPVAAFDSVLSMKQGVNLSRGKNLCGTYFPPALVACDARWLSTMSTEGQLTGVAEMAKNVLSVAPELTGTLTRSMAGLRDGNAGAFLDLLELGVAAKAPFLRTDPKERKEALVFEYGHTVGHALEFASRGTMSHGEAVAWGMLVAAEVAHAWVGMKKADLYRHYELVSLLGLPDPRTRLAGLDPHALRALLATDNKRGYIPCSPREIPMVLLEEIGRVRVGPKGFPLVAVPEDLVMSSIATVARTGGAGVSGDRMERVR